MARVKLNVSKREGVGSSNSRRLRFTGVIPCIIYGKAKEPMPVSATIKDIHGIKGVTLSENTLLDLTVKSGTEELHKTVIIKEIQKDAIKGDLMHIDFNEISLKERLKTKVPLDLKGDPVGVTLGGVLDQLMHELEIECLPTDIPERITVDVSGIELGHALFVKNIAISEKITILSNPELPVASVALPKEEEVAPATAEGAAAEPEVIGKGKKEEGEAEAAGGGKEAKEAKETKEAKPKEEKK